VLSAFLLSTQSFFCNMGLLMINSLRDYLEVLRKKGLLLEVREQVFREDLPELIASLQGSGKALLFTDVAGYSGRVAANLVPAQDCFADIFETTGNHYEYFINALKRREQKLPTVEHDLVTTAMEGRELLDHLPILKHYEQDSAPFITAAIASSRDPETGAVARGIHRLEWRKGNRVGIALLNPPLSELFEKYKRLQRPMPISLSIGNDLAVLLAMALKPLPDTDKLEIAGGLKGRGIATISSFDSDIDVPQSGEILLEGLVDYDDCRPDGPLGEISGYYMSLRETPTIVVKRLSCRPSPIYHVLLPTCLEADMYLTFVSYAHIHETLMRLYPFVMRLHFIPKTFGSSVVVQVKSVETQRIRSLITFVLSFPMIKKVVVVDEDVDAEDYRDVEWAMATRFDPRQDLIVIDNLPVQPIDPQKKEGQGLTKMGMNATAFGKNIEARAIIAQGERTRIEAIVKLYGSG
jgi:2,5-furandicarboxylate decarboxylase 1